MARKKLIDLAVQVQPETFLYGACLFLLIPLQCVAALAMSVAVHEFGHLAALRLLGIPINAIVVRPQGIQIRTPSIPPGKELFCALAGPLGGLCLLLTARWFPLLALFALFHSLYNLLPLYPGDGGRILRNLCGFFMPHRWTDMISKVLGRTAGIALLAAGFYGTFALKLGLIPIILGMSTAINAWKNK